MPRKHQHTKNTMTTIYHPTHPHYAVHKEYTEGCFANPDNPPVVQVKCDDSFLWHETQPAWNIKFEYRIKPLTTTITRTVTYPEPMREEPLLGSQVWFVSGHPVGPYFCSWNDAPGMRVSLKNGLCFATEADAQACYDALFAAAEIGKAIPCQAKSVPGGEG